jgi:hypothetical protein
MYGKKNIKKKLKEALSISIWQLHAKRKKKKKLMVIRERINFI